MNFLLRKLAKRWLLSDWSVLNKQIGEMLEEVESSTFAKHFIHLDEILVLAEDKRFFRHSGVDWLATFRAAIKTYVFGKTQGASTITQQLVRSLNGRYEKTFQRKLKEILLALLVDASIGKALQIKAYLWVAYFGWRMNGIEQAAHRLNIRFPCSPVQACMLVARLKYPEPRSPSVILSKKIALREKNLLLLYQSTLQK